GCSCAGLLHVLGPDDVGDRGVVGGGGRFGGGPRHHGLHRLLDRGGHLRVGGQGRAVIGGLEEAGEGVHRRAVALAALVGGDVLAHRDVVVGDRVVDQGVGGDELLEEGEDDLPVGDVARDRQPPAAGQGDGPAAAAVLGGHVRQSHDVGPFRPGAGPALGPVLGDPGAVHQ